MSKAAVTRLTILQKAFEQIYRNGFQNTSIDDIIARTQVTKGAFFYHFKNKEEMGLAMIDELIAPGIQDILVKPLTQSRNPADDIYAVMENMLLRSPFFQVEYGCPAVNLIDEMSPVNQPFHKALTKLIKQCQDAVEVSIKQGVASGTVKQGVDSYQVACFVMAGYSGIRNLGKLLGASCYKSYLQGLKIYLSELS